MGAALLRVNKMQEKWRVKLRVALEAKEKQKHRWGDARGNMRAVKLWSEKYVMFLLPFVTVLREGLEAVIFMSVTPYLLCLLSPRSCHVGPCSI